MTTINQSDKNDDDSAQPVKPDTATSGTSANPPVRLQPIANPSLDKSVIDALIIMIEKSSIQVGDRLPTEQTLARVLGVGRSTIREALKAWQSMGIVTRNRGAGTVLATRITSNSVHVPITLQLEAESLLRTNAVRRPLEVESVRLAATRASSSQHELIQQRCDLLQETYSKGHDWREADGQFHAAIHEACGNPLFGQLSRQILEVFHGIYRDPLGVPLLGESSIPIHAQLAEAIIAGQTAQAVQHMLSISQIVEDEVNKHIRAL